MEEVLALASDPFQAISNDEVRLTPTGLLRVDQLLPLFYAPEFQHSRYT